MTEITKTNETAQKAHAEQLGKLQVQLKEQTETSNKQPKEFNESLKKMQPKNILISFLQVILTKNNVNYAKNWCMDEIFYYLRIINLFILI